jgi:hypothetical protein
MDLKGGRPMDPMLEIAPGFLRSEREAASKVPLNNPTTDSHSRNISPEQIYTDIDSEIKRLNLHIMQTAYSHKSLQVVKKAFWESRDERVQEILAHVFYARPLMARKVCEIAPQLIPEFVHYLADEGRRAMADRESIFGSNHGKKRLQELFEKYEYVVMKRSRMLLNFI